MPASVAPDARVEVVEAIGDSVPGVTRVTREISGRVAPPIAFCPEGAPLAGHLGAMKRHHAALSAPPGWWYSLPVPGGDRVIALLTDPDLTGADRRASFVDQLARTRHIRARVETPPAEVAAFPAGAAHREQIVGDDWLAIGDAAVSFDPLSSQGLITGIVMAAHAAVAIDAGQQALADWAADYRVVLDEHLQVRRAFWAEEQRWTDAPYWARRRT